MARKSTKGDVDKPVVPDDAVLTATEPDETVPAVEERAKGPKRLKICNPDYAGQKVGGVSGVAEFDANGIAEVDPANFAFFCRVPGYSAAE